MFVHSAATQSLVPNMAGWMTRPKKKLFRNIIFEEYLQWSAASSIIHGHGNKNRKINLIIKGPAESDVQII